MSDLVSNLQFHARCAAIALMLAGLVGCDRAEVRVYDEPKPAASANTPTAAASTEPAASGDVQDITVEGIHFHAPADWTRDPSAIQFRIAGFTIGAGKKRADMSIARASGMSRLRVE